jgi:hypothetical protein
VFGVPSGQLVWSFRQQLFLSRVSYFTVHRHRPWHA